MMLTENGVLQYFSLTSISGIYFCHGIVSCHAGVNPSTVVVEATTRTTAAAVTVEGFTPASRQLVQGGRPATTTQLQKSIFDAISDMDLWAPDKDANTYGARKKKKLGIGDIKAGKSYVPDGLTAAQYQELR